MAYFTDQMCILRLPYVMVIANILFVCFLKLAVVFLLLVALFRFVFKP